MKCPSCGFAAAADAPECPSCGLIFAKWRERQEKEKADALKALDDAGSSAPKPALNPWVSRSAAGALVLLWVGGLVFVYYRHARPRREPLGVDTGTFVEMRDPKTGEMRRLPIRRLGVPAGPPTVPTEPAPDASGQ